MKQMKFATKAIHAGQEPDPTTGAIMTPIYQTSTYWQASPGDHKGYEYSRGTNPTRKALEDCLAALENCKFGLAFSSGMGATDCLLRLLKPGDEVITGNDLYGGSYRIFTKIYQNYGIKFHFLDLSKPENIMPYINEKTKLVWIETPTNPTMRIIDIEGVAKITKANNILLTVDNTFASPYLQNPIDLGADVVMHSVTKYIGGHSDVVMGALLTNNEQLYKDLFFVYNACGATPGPQDAFLVLRGIKTLALRVQRHSENGMAVAKYLESHPAVAQVIYPGLESHPQYELAKSQMKDFGGMVSFTFKSGKKEDAIKFLEKVRVFTLAESLGGVESLVCHPVSMTHGSIPKEQREKLGITDSLVRLSVGIENIDDLLKDIAQALESLH